MAGGLDYARARRRARVGAATASDRYYQRPHRGWRTEWDGDPFPVVVGRIEANGKQDDSKVLSNLDQGQETA